MKKVLVNLLVFTISLSVSLLIAEFALRIMIFSKSAAFKKLRTASSYADSWNEQNYWTLYSMFEGNTRAPKNPHPLLGWIGDFDRGSLLHNKAEGIRNKRPVLLYGDSYAQCLNATCYEEFLNKDSAFTKNNFFLNYGTGGYGVDQIYLTMHHTAFHYKKPFVIFSLMVSDLDRTMLTYRLGQKPKFNIQDDSLVLTNVPISHNSNEYLKNHPPQIKSYLWRLFYWSKLNIFPQWLNDKLAGNDAYIENKIKLNGMILQKAVDELRAHQTDFMFVIFHHIKRNDKEHYIDNDTRWSDKFLLDFLHKNNIPYIWSKEVIKNDTAYHKTNIDKYLKHHPTSYFNELLASKMKQAVLKNEEQATPGDTHVNQSSEFSWYYSDRIEEAAKKIQGDSVLSKKCIEEGQRTNVSLDDAIFSEAKTLFNKQYENNSEFPLR